MPAQTSHIIIKDGYQICAVCPKQKNILHLSVINKTIGQTYEIDWKDLQSPWKNPSQFYKFIKKDNGKSMTVMDLGSALIVSQKYKISLTKKDMMKQSQKNPLIQSFNSNQKEFIQQAFITNNLFINKKILFINQFPYNQIGLIYGLDEEIVKKYRDLPDENIQQFLQKQKKNQHIIGTGCMISSRLVLTCAHNIYKKDKEQKLSFQRQNLYFNLMGQKRKIRDIRLPKQYIQAKDQKIYEQYDYSLLLLEGGVQKKKKNYLQICFDYFQRCKATIYGFPGNDYNTNETLQFNRFKNNIKQTGAADYIGWYENGMMYYDINTEHGQSGSAVMTMINGQLMVIGIHIGYSKEINRNVAVHLNKNKIQQILQWEIQLKGIFSKQIKTQSAQNLKKSKENVQKQQSITKQQSKTNNNNNNNSSNNDNSNNNKKKKQTSIKDSDLWFQNAKKHTLGQRYEDALYSLNKALSLCKQEQYFKKIDYFLEFSIVYRKKQTLIDLELSQNMLSQIQLNQQNKKKRLKPKEIKELKKSNKLSAKKMQENMQTVGLLKDAEDSISQALKIIQKQKQKIDKKLQNKFEQLQKIFNIGTEQLQLNKQIHSKKLEQLENQIQTLKKYKQKVYIKYILIKIEASNVFVAFKDLKSAELILKQLQEQIQAKIIKFNSVQYSNYKYLLIFVYLKLGLVYEKLDGSIIKKAEDQYNYTKKKQADQCFDLALEMEQSEVYIQEKYISDTYSLLFQVLFKRLKGNFKIENQLIIYAWKCLKIIRQCNMTVYNENYLQARSQFEEGLTFLYEKSEQDLKRIRDFLCQFYPRQTQNQFSKNLFIKINEKSKKIKEKNKI